MSPTNQQLKDLLEAEKEEFLSVMSHELRTPMTGTKGYLSMILSGDVGEVPPEIKEYAAQAYIANEKLIKLVDQMFKAAQLQEGKFRLKIGKVNLTEQIKILITDFAIPAQEKNLTLKHRLAKKEIDVRADPDRLREILMNLLSNAVKFTAAGGKVTVSEHIEGDWAVVKVQDTGCGIKREDQQRLFEIFAKGNLTLTGQEKGTGLGLYVARRLAEAQGGKVWLDESAPNKGSVFAAAFPLVS